jgi:TolB-like protein
MRNFSPDPNDEYFADGMTEELIDRLAQVKSLKVIARTSVMNYKKKEKNVSEIAKELGVGSLVEGSVRKAGNRVRVTVQLINAGTEEHLWSSHYDNNLDDIFAVQSEIAEKVAGELKAQLLDSEKETLQKKPTENLEAYGNFLRGKELFRDEKEASVRQALALFEKAIELDPGFAKAYVGVAECHEWLGNAGNETYEVSVSAVKTSLDHAVNLDPNLPEAHAALSSMFFVTDDMPRMEAEAKKALDLNPNIPETYSMLSELAAIRGDPAEMVRMIERAYGLDPIRPRFIWAAGVAYLNAGREQEALEFWKKTEHLAPAFSYRGMAQYYIINGDLQSAKEFQVKYERLEPRSPRATSQRGTIAAMEGEREKALLAIKEIEDAKIGPLGFNFIGYIYHALGDLDSFFDCMNKALETHALIPSFLLYSRFFTKTRADPRYHELVEKLRSQLGVKK